jgi:hypothetical protein
MVCALSILSNFCLGIYQDFQKEGKIGKKDQAEQAYAKLDQIQD